MKFSPKILFLTLLIFSFRKNSEAQNLTSSPYSRYGIGEINQQGFSNIAGMGGTFIGVKADTNAPVFINVANPAAIANIRYASLELGGSGNSRIIPIAVLHLKIKRLIFSYGCLGFPIRQKAAACFGVLPYSNVGYNLSSKQQVANVGEVKYNYTGAGGFSKVFFRNWF